ncbi:FFLEELY motif protein [Noviherbaspirillum galbum]|uniref:DUF8198 domain-containing protein n=1 Tax=Noviherbaspirillum galbum TaxID=2709383 RepID=A0A6B3SU62_9BURK|nr:hypothetical protein [Noviherbaspirillum galbum]NEX62905.1 hypothetical protein [Noviherbaspirillum galbum]
MKTVPTAPRPLDRKEIAATLRRDLATVSAERRAASASPQVHAARLALRRFQAARLRHTHADLLAGPGTQDAARFFLSDLYSSEDLTERDARLEKLLPVMEALLPVEALAAAGSAIALDALSEELDAGMARRLGTAFTPKDYAEAYRLTGRREDREEQLARILKLGEALCRLVTYPAVGTALTAMRKPALLAGFSPIQRFLEAGFRAFRTLDDPGGFMRKIETREKRIMLALYEGAPDPLETG